MILTQPIRREPPRALAWYLDNKARLRAAQAWFKLKESKNQDHAADIYIAAGYEIFP
jgi:hypothetical protein